MTKCIDHRHLLLPARTACARTWTHRELTVAGPEHAGKSPWSRSDCNVDKRRRAQCIPVQEAHQDVVVIDMSDLPEVLPAHCDLALHVNVGPEADADISSRSLVGFKLLVLRTRTILFSSYPRSPESAFVYVPRILRAARNSPSGIMNVRQICVRTCFHAPKRTKVAATEC
ncbi:hypothetical protein C8Q74DRAFT_606851 [Fomes fomentarius]|nr:hypothetical protein C8Q74DRAFT_606851 [Fomes fomentarius]